MRHRGRPSSFFIGAPQSPRHAACGRPDGLSRSGGAHARAPLPPGRACFQPPSRGQGRRRPFRQKVEVSAEPERRPWNVRTLDGRGIAGAGQPSRADTPLWTKRRRLCELQLWSAGDAKVIARELSKREKSLAAARHHISDTISVRGLQTSYWMRAELVTSCCTWRINTIYAYRTRHALT